jgi:hypothetical protein
LPIAAVSLATVSVDGGHQEGGERMGSGRL